MSEKDPKEKEYMKASKETLKHPPDKKEGLEEPRVTGYKPIQIGIVVFVIIVLIIIIIGISSNMWGLFG
ncbi:hypothetical protein QWY16_16640 [Planococcus shenhongbingii]|uniref:Uncharacterized protein n=1 Tax=Planococcus shenhongbingii TaxID=3058398 RepID=A0ABT8NAV5_9BACL|nr:MULTISPECIES: hypothetical protein [unclassified Planococcus (in: firmicutes)]MDN7245009.1 hypothetical protein [Planococcus sp. N017]WKA58107.1 hypothetical protein QWY16_16640 [Planococcus sp. N016]